VTDYLAVEPAPCFPWVVHPARIAVAALAAILTLSSGALPGVGPKRHTTAHAVSLGPSALHFGRSLGSPTEGHLLGGAHLEETSYLRVVPAYETGDVRWGLEPLVTMIDRAARQVRRQFPDAVTSVGHLSREGGGEIDRHHSHESGRDADIGFFVRSGSGRQLLASHFVAFRGDGTAASWPGAVFDDAKNWLLVAALVGDPEAHVTHVFVAAPLRARLLAYAERMGVPANLRIRAAEILQQPRGALPHDDHFHVRIGCPPRMSGCVENPAARGRRGPMLAGHGRRGPPSRASFTSAPTAHASHAPARAPLPPPGSRPLEQSPAGVDPEERHGAEPPDEPDAPPASMPAPIDDVDG
jgi:penicillin-insensitive murein endopeptidase